MIRKKIEIPKEVKDTKLWKQATVFQFVYSIVGLLLGIGCIITGIILLIKGILLKQDFNIKVFNFESNLTNTSVGVILFLIGILVIFITKFSIKAK